MEPLQSPVGQNTVIAASIPPCMVKLQEPLKNIVKILNARLLDLGRNRVS